MNYLRRLFRHTRIHTVEEVLAFEWLHRIRREGYRK